MRACFSRLPLRLARQLLIACIGGSLTISVGLAQPASEAMPTRAFDVASIKPNPTGSGAFSIDARSPGTFKATNVTLMRLLTAGYRVQKAQIIGGPNWLTSARFDVIAKGAENATREELFLMIQPLLVDRFKLKFHRETRVLPHYELVVANNGSKLVKGENGRCAKALEASRPCSDIAEMTNGIAAVNMPLSTIARALGGILEDRPVMDKTGLAGRFDIQVMWKDSRLAQTEDERRGDEVPESMFTALQEQAGLRLLPAKGPVEVFVIDHVDRPSEN